jgi:colanic acid/amylovoran biosynthesis protein WcaK/AmsJ
VAPTDRRLHIWVTNAVCMNGGDATIVEATMRTLRDALAPREVEFTVLDSRPEVSARLVPGPQFRPWPWSLFTFRRFRRLPGPLRRLLLQRAYLAAFLIGRGRRGLARLLLRRSEWTLLLEYSRADLVVSKGGTYLVEHYNLEPHLFDYRLCLLLRRPLVFGPQSLGPFVNEHTRRELRTILPQATVFLRDALSQEHLEALGVRVASEVTADVAFALADSEAIARSRDRSLPPHPTVAVSVRHWKHFAALDGMPRYEDAIEALVTHLVRRHAARVTFLSTCQGVPEYSANDSRLARRITARLPSDVTGNVQIDDAWHSPMALQEILASFDLAIATRMHFAILALNAGVPVFPIAYEFKTTELFHRLGLAAWVQDIETVEPRRLVQQLEGFLNAFPACRADVFRLVERERLAAIENARTIADHLAPRLQS